MKLAIPIYLFFILLMDLISMYHLSQYRGMKRYEKGIQIGGVLFIVSVALAIAPLMYFLSNTGS